MPDEEPGGRGREITVLGEDECRALLARHSLGRLGFVSEEGWPVILPVNYVFDEPSIVVRTGAGTKLSDIPLTMVAFEVDAADAAGTWGWSVLAQGPAFDITDSLDDYSDSLRHLPVDPRAPGDKPHWLKISARRLSGRCFGEVPADS